MARKDILNKEAEFRKWAEEGKTRKEIAELLNCSIPTVKKYADILNIDIVLQKKSVEHEDLTGQSFEKSQLIVLERDFEPHFKSHESAYKCECMACHEIRTYRKSNIINGPGCLCLRENIVGRGHRKWNVGDKYGFLTIIGEGKSPEFVLCECKCGTIKNIRLQHLRGQSHSRTISCGCSQVSSGELKISQILNENNIKYISQYQITDLSKFMSFDFAILDDNGNVIKLIEYDGEQHFKPIEKWGGEEKFLIQKERDERKNQYCKENNLNLLRIPYYDFDKITLNYLLSDIRN